MNLICFIWERKNQKDTRTLIIFTCYGRILLRIGQITQLDVKQYKYRVPMIVILYNIIIIRFQFILNFL